MYLVLIYFAPCITQRLNTQTTYYDETFGYKAWIYTAGTKMYKTIITDDVIMLTSKST